MNPLRPFAVVILAPLALLALAGALTFQAASAGAEARALQDRLARVVSRPLAEPVTRGAALLMPGTSAGLAASAFQGAARKLAEGAGAEVVQMESAPMEPAPPLTRLHLTIRLRGTEPQIAATLTAIEAATPLIRADRLDLRGEGQDDGILDATLVLSAWSAGVQP